MLVSLIYEFHVAMISPHQGSRSSLDKFALPTGLDMVGPVVRGVLTVEPAAKFMIDEIV